ADSADVRARRPQVAREMPAPDRVRDVAEAIDQEYPREKEMPRARHRQPLMARNREPRREPLGIDPAVVRRSSEDAARNELMAEQSRVADRPALGILLRADLEPRRTT